MAIEFTKQEIAELTPSLRKFFNEELEIELSEMQAGFVLTYIAKEVAPVAYNRGVADAESFVRAKVEELSAVCYEEPMTYWLKKRK
jgi:uncharacterized protein (DUF2164 family)